MFKIITFHIFLALTLFETSLCTLNALDYQVEFVGNLENETHILLEETSQLSTLQNSPASSAAALQRRADKDISNLLKALQSQAYYGAKVKTSINFDLTPAVVKIEIETGPIYPLTSFSIVSSKETVNDEDYQYPFASIDIQDLEITINNPAFPKDVLNAEEILLKRLEREGYPLAKIVQREVLADQTSKSVSVTLHLDSGHLARFGPTSITGQKRVQDIFFCRKITWQEGALYQPEQVARTLNALEASGLFSSITIRYADEVDENGMLPMNITVTEAKHRSIGLGLNYDTDLGPGLSAEWENRNLRGRGEKLSFVTNLWLRKKEGTLRYTIPDFYRPRQDLIWTAEALNLDTRGFEESSLSLSGIIERQLNDNIRFSYGGMFKRLRNWDSDNNGSFNLLKAPLQFMWHKTNSLLDPTQGSVVLIKSTPTLETKSPRFAYSINTISGSIYVPLRKDQRFVIAAKATLGSIWGANKHSIPPSERFYAGSDNLLRGYRYLTVSPLNEENKPIGGRSMMVYSLEARMRFSECFGFVTFWDIGNVYANSHPQINHKQLQAVGVGARYHTPVGPIRLDIAFPLNPRKHVDNRFQIYFSIGQSF
ncbi:MAG: outer membrane protein assembly factor [Parachlamydiaceae bacterium]|nr:outer membrane protein assembly factor [Parachlamydiaceae bacterium]